jgi:hypothetical protein
VENMAVVVVGRCVSKREVSEGLRVKNPKSSCWGSISGTLSEMGVNSGRRRWCSRADEVAVVVGRYFRKCEAGKGAEGQNGEIELLGLDFGRAIKNGDGDQRGNVVRWCG